MGRESVWRWLARVAPGRSVSQRGCSAALPMLLAPLLRRTFTVPSQVPVSLMGKVGERPHADQPSLRGQAIQGEEMRYGGGFRFLAALLVVGVIAALTAGAYGAGYAAGAGPNASVSPWVYGGFIGFGNVIGLIVTIFVLVMIFRVML